MVSRLNESRNSVVSFWRTPSPRAVHNVARYACVRSRDLRHRLVWRHRREATSTWRPRLACCCCCCLLLSSAAGDVIETHAIGSTEFTLGSISRILYRDVYVASYLYRIRVSKLYSAAAFTRITWWNSLLENTGDFSSLSKFKRSVLKVNLSRFLKWF